MAIQSLEEVFVKEFKKSTGLVGIKDIYNIPLPKGLNWNVCDTDIYAVKGIEGSFSGLNKTLVKKLPSGMQAKRRKIDKATRNFMRDPNGGYVYEDYKVPTGSQVVLSNKNLGLSYKEYLNPKEGYGYVDFKGTKENATYVYLERPAKNGASFNLRLPLRLT